MLKIRMKQNISIQLIKEKAQAQTILKILKLLLRDVYKNINDYNPDPENTILIVFHNMIADMVHNKKLYSTLTEWFIRGRKLNISFVFITQLYFKVPKYVRLNTTHSFIAKIPNKRKLQQIVINHSSDINPKDFINIYRKCTVEPYACIR